MLSLVSLLRLRGLPRLNSSKYSTLIMRMVVMETSCFHYVQLFIILNNITAFCSGQTPFFLSQMFFLLVHHDDDGDDEGLQLDYFLHFYIRIHSKAKEPYFPNRCKRYYFGGNLRPQGVTVREYKEKQNPTKHEENCHNGNQ